jgi:hypothetical protein
LRLTLFPPIPLGDLDDRTLRERIANLGNANVEWASGRITGIARRV